MLDALEDLAPVITVERHAVDEECHRALPSLEKRDASGHHVSGAPVGMEGRNIHGASVASEAKLGKLPAPRCHDLAGLDGLFTCSGAPQHRRGAAEEATEARREV